MTEQNDNPFPGAYAVVLASRPLHATAAILLAALRSAAPEAMTETGDAAEPGARGSQLITTHEGTIAALEIDAPHPGLDDFHPPRPLLLWPTVTADLARQRAYVIITAVARAGGIGAGGRLRLARAVTAVAGAYAGLSGAIGVYWMASENFLPVHLFAMAAEEAGSEDLLPLLAWIRLNALPAATGAIVTTHGLRNGIGREIEVAPTSLPPGVVLPFIMWAGHTEIRQSGALKQATRSVLLAARRSASPCSTRAAMAGRCSGSHRSRETLMAYILDLSRAQVSDPMVPQLTVYDPSKPFRQLFDNQMLQEGRLPPDSDRPSQIYMRGKSKKFPDLVPVNSDIYVVTERGADSSSYLLRRILGSSP